MVLGSRRSISLPAGIEPRSRALGVTPDQLAGCLPAPILGALGVLFVLTSAAWADRTPPVRFDFDPAQSVSLTAQVIPTLTRLGCNTGSCHGKSGGQHGFALSLFGADPGADRAALMARINKEDRPASLLLAKPTAQVPHGGGERLVVDSLEYQTLVRWIDQVESRQSARVEPRLIRLEAVPSHQTLQPGASGRIRVVASWDDGSSVDVTRLSQFESNAMATANVDTQGGIMAGRSVGAAAILIRYAGEVGVARVVVPSGRRLLDLATITTKGVDGCVDRQLAELGLEPAATTTDAEFARRSSLDINGMLPDPDAVASFEHDDQPDKRTRWVDGLLARPEYADFFAAKWAAILRNRRALGDRSKPGTFAFHGWLRAAVAENWPYDRLVGAIIAGKGDALSNPAVEWYRNVGSLSERTDDVAQVFLGTRIGCARCHHHPSERWGMEDHAGLASFFARVETRGGSDPNTFTVFSRATDPRPDATLPRPLGEATLDRLGPRDDPRDALLTWMVAPENPYFARAVVNRYWKHFLGVGIVEPEDDLRATNPPGNPELLDTLAADFRAHGFDLKWLIRTIATSTTYARSSLPHPANPPEYGQFARQIPRRLPAEVLLDAIDTMTGFTEHFDGVPTGTKATQLPDDGFVSPWLDAFGRPPRRTACECERTTDPSLSQALFLLNSTDLEDRINHPDGRAARYALDQTRPDRDKVDELYRLALARQPTVEEQTHALAYLGQQRQKGQIRAGFEDLIWSVINTKEFLFNH